MGRRATRVPEALGRLYEHDTGAYGRWTMHQGSIAMEITIPTASRAATRPIAVVRSVAILLGILIALGLLAAVMLDRNARIDAARRQSTAVATGVDRLMHFEIRNLERALKGMSREVDGGVRSPADSGWNIFEAVRGVLSRQGELQGIAVHDAAGRLMYDEGVRAPEASMVFPGPMFGGATLQELARHPAGSLMVGKLQHGGRGEPVVPLALRTPDGNWLVARLRTSELQRMLAGLDVGVSGSASILDANGVILALHGTGAGRMERIGRSVRLPNALTPGATLQRDIVSELDGVTRFASFSAASGYPFIVAAGLARKDILAPWRHYALTAASAVLLYWLAMAYLMHRMMVAEALRVKTQEALLRHADWLTRAQQASRAGVWAMDEGDTQVQASAEAAELFGFPRVAGSLPVEDFFLRMHDDDRERVRREFQWAREHRTPFQSEYRIHLPAGGERWINARGALVDDGSDRTQMVGTIVDVSERRAATARLEQAEQQFRELFELNPLPFWVFDTETLAFLAVNAAAIRTYGYLREEFLTMTILQIRPRDAEPAVRASVREAAQEDVYHRDSSQIWIHETRYGTRMHVRVHSSSICFDGRPARLVLAEDVSERVAYEADLAWRAEHDEGTGLLKLRTLLERLDAAPVEEGSTGYAIAYVQLRDLELLSPTLGQRTGEAIVREIARRLAEVGGAYGEIGYVPEGVFVIAAVDGRRVRAMVASVQAAIAEPVDSDNGSHRVEAWIGIAHKAHDTDSAEHIVGYATLAALQARADNTPMMKCEPRMAERASGRLATIANLRRALSANEFALHFQPILRLSDGVIVSVEALLRWQDAFGNFIPPSQFIPLSEESGLIIPIGEWVLTEAARAHVALADAGFGDIPIAVNASAEQFVGGSFPRILRHVRRTYGLTRDALQVELTESAMMRRPDEVRAAIDDLHRDGVCIAIDDFGTGFSSMVYLRDLAVDFLKLDRGFVEDVHNDARNAAICLATISLAHGLGLEVIAEGVEEAAQLQWLRDHGCDQAQGFLMARPEPLEALIQRLRAALTA